MDIQNLLSETGEKGLEAAIDMMKLLLDTVGDKLQEKEVAYQFFGLGHRWFPAGSVCPGTAVTVTENRQPSGQTIFQCAC